MNYVPSDRPDPDELVFGGFDADPKFYQQKDAVYNPPQVHPGFAPHSRELRAKESLAGADFTASRNGLGRAPEAGTGSIEAAI
ncbi:MAG: hypothetical protein PW734_07080 [Verrucomicrobium sp.]|nr:hypothetical protein [Verrucomicrobium sp.]